MALFSKKEERPPYEVLKPKLAEKDDKLHVVMMNTWHDHLSIITGI